MILGSSEENLIDNITYPRSAFAPEGEIMAFGVFNVFPKNSMSEFSTRTRMNGVHVPKHSPDTVARLQLVT